mmetsp:Transcript_3107/g.5223  ORF Transcript_3107/g.5223 Transcript_3107/m.5223 type:complete len:347 (+) Transcript_3107:325-1365(+)
MALDGELIIAAILDLLDGIPASGIVSQEASRHKLEVLNGIILPPHVVRHKLGHIGIHAFALSHESVLVHPVVVDELGDVVPDVVGADDHAPLSSSDVVLLDVLDGGGHGSSRGASAQESLLLDHSSGVVESVLITDFNPVVNEGTVADTRNEVISDTFDLVHATGGLLLVEGLRLSEDGADGVNGDDLDIGVLLLELPGNSSQGASSAGSHEHVVKLALTLVPDLLARLIVMSHGVARVLVLVEDVRVLEVLAQLPGKSNVGLGVVEGVLVGGPDDFSAQRLKNINLFLRHFLGQGNNHPESLGGSRDRQPNTSVSGGRLDQDVALLDSIGGHSVHHHSPPDSILD